MALVRHSWVCSPHSLRSSQYPRVQAAPTTELKAPQRLGLSQGLLGTGQGRLFRLLLWVKEETGACSRCSGTKDLTWSQGAIKGPPGNHAPERPAGPGATHLSSLPRAAEAKGLTPQRVDSGCKGRPARTPSAQVPGHTDQAGARRPRGTGSGLAGVPPQDAPEGGGGVSEGRSGTS